MSLLYKPFLQKAYRYAVHDILTHVAQNGLCDDSHYFITFQTNRNDVIIPDFVRAKYPEEISIVLQNQFENLCVYPELFSVDLSFGGVKSTLTVPFTAIKIFADPAAQFLLSFEPEQPLETPQQKSEEIVDLTQLRTGK